MIDFIGEIALRSWPELNTVLKNELTEEQLQNMLDHELTNKKRASFVERIHARLSKIKTLRERDELLEKCKSQKGQGEY